MLAPDTPEESVSEPLLLSGAASVAEEVLVVEDAESVPDGVPSDRLAPVRAPRLSVPDGEFEAELVLIAEPLMPVDVAAAVSTPVSDALPVPVTGAIMSCLPRGRTSRWTDPLG